MSSIELDPATAKQLADAITSGRYASLDDFLADITNERQGAIRLRLPSMVDRVDIDELAREQGVEPFDASRRVNADIWPEDDNIDQFLAHLREQRRDLPPEMTP